MTFSKFHNSVTLYLTPGILRSWAELCERKFANAVPGSSVIFHEIDDGDTLIRLAFDQDRMHRE